MELHKILERKTLYSGPIFDLCQRVVELPNGKKVSRDVIEHKGASVIIAVTDPGDLVMVRQYRNGTDSIMLELPAGKLDTGEDPQVCALRELEEETGYKASEIRLLLKMHPVAAYCSEEISLFLAERLKPGVPKPDADEFVEVETYPLPELLQLIDAGGITDMKTILGLLYYSRMKGI